MMDIQAFLDALFARAKCEGIEQCEAYVAASDAFEAYVNKGEITDYAVSNSLGLSFRALIEGKMGYASTQALDEAAIELLIEGAKTNAALIESEDEQAFFAGGAAYLVHELYNPALESVGASEKLDWLKALEACMLSQDERVKQTDACLISSGSAQLRIVNSLGLSLSHRDNMVIAACMPVAKDGEKVSTGMGFAMARDMRDLSMKEIAEEAVDEAISALSAAPVPSGSYRIVLKNTAATSLLSAFVGIFSADQAQKDLSLLRGREGEVIASDAVTLMDDPFCGDGFAGAPFDAEGVPSKKKAVIERGTLTTLLHNLKTAKKQGLPASTGNASKASYQSPVGVAPSNFYFLPGELSFEALMAQYEGGLLITDLQGLHCANALSGDFSLSAKGFVIEGRRMGKAVEQITISGNFYQLLKDIECVGADLRFGFPGSVHCGSPALGIKSLFVAGE